MNSGFEIPRIQPNDNTSSAPVLLPMSRSNHIFEQINVLPTSQQLFLEHHHHLLPPHHYSDVGASSYFPLVNFKLGLNEICSRNEHLKDRGEGLQFEVQKNRHSSLGVLHCWNDNQGSSLKQQQPFWEPLPAEASNENSEIVDRQEHIELNQKQITTSIDGKFHFGELEEAIYKRCQNNTNTPSQNHHHLISNSQNPSDFNHGFEENQRKKKRRKGDSYYGNELMNPMAEFFSNFVKQIMDHQESLHHKFTEMIERLDEERRAREEHWRNEEMVHFQQEMIAARAREKILKQSRESMIVSYLEKITGQKVNFSCEITSTSNANEEQLGKKCSG